MAEKQKPPEKPKELIEHRIKTMGAYLRHPNAVVYNEHRYPQKVVLFLRSLFEDPLLKEHRLWQNLTDDQLHTFIRKVKVQRTLEGIPETELIPRSITRILSIRSNEHHPTNHTESPFLRLPDRYGPYVLRLETNARRPPGTSIFHIEAYVDKKRPELAELLLYLPLAETDSAKVHEQVRTMITYSKEHEGASVIFAETNKHRDRNTIATRLQAIFAPETIAAGTSWHITDAQLIVNAAMSPERFPPELRRYLYISDKHKIILILPEQFSEKNQERFLLEVKGVTHHSANDFVSIELRPNRDDVPQAYLDALG